MQPPTKWTYRVTATLLVVLLAVASRYLTLEVRPVDGAILFWLGLVADLVQDRMTITLTPSDLPINHDRPASDRRQADRT